MRRCAPFSARKGETSAFEIVLDVSRFHGTVQSEESFGSLSIVLVEYDEGCVIAAHDHPRPYVSFLVDGSYTEVSAGIPRLCHPGAVIVHGPAENHADIFHRPARMLNVEFEWPCPLVSIAGVIAPRLHSLNTPLDVASAMLAFLRTSPDSRCRPRPAHWLDRIIVDFAWVSKHPLTDAARMAGIHPTHFSRAFRQHTGMTPYMYRTRERVRAASARLLGSTSALSEVALECGYNDQSHFSNAFRATTGVTPAKYRDLFWR
jgi:AraC-like DNA-binding protein/quercetin dioxygenase-like cupin family protein